MKYFSVILISVFIFTFCQSCTLKNKPANSSTKQNDEFNFSLVFYGKYCGPGHPRNAEFDKDAKDVIDQVCKDHDTCYSKSWYFNEDCDAEIAKAILDKDLVGFKQKVLGVLIATYFSISPSAGDNNFLQLLIAPETIETDNKNPFEQPVVVIPTQEGPSLGIAFPFKLPEIIFSGIANLFSDEESEE